MEHQPEPTDRIKLGLGNLRIVVSDHLNIIYAAKNHLVAKLPEIASHVHYTDLREGILETVSDVEKQMARVELVLTLLDANISSKHCAGMLGMIDEAFQSIQRNTARDHGLRDCPLLITCNKSKVWRRHLSRYWRWHP